MKIMYNYLMMNHFPLSTYIKIQFQVAIL